MVFPYSGRALRDTEWYVECPFLRLQSYLEDWIGLLPAWTKYFFVEDLVYRHRNELEKYADFRTGFTGLEAQLRRKGACERVFQQLREGFQKEADRIAEGRILI